MEFLNLLAFHNLKVTKKFLETITERANFNNPEYVALRKRLEAYSVDILISNEAKWHRSCYSEVTHTLHFQRDKNRYEKAIGQRNTGILTSQKKRGRPSSVVSHSVTENKLTNLDGMVTRSSFPLFNRSMCFFCQEDRFTYSNHTKLLEQLYNCRTSDISGSIEKIIKKANKDSWNVNFAEIIADQDFLSRGIKYHKSCCTSNWSQYLQSPERKVNDNKYDSIKFISAEIEFFAEIQERVDEGQGVTITEAEIIYSNMMRDYDLDIPNTKRYRLLQRIRQNVTCNITEGRGSKPTLIHCKEAQCAEINSENEEKARENEMNVIFQCAKIIRKSIIRKRSLQPWDFHGSLRNAAESAVPQELITMIRWIIQGAEAASSSQKADELHKICLMLSNYVAQECKSKRQVSHVTKRVESTFRNMYENPYAVGISLYLYHNFKSQKAISLMHGCCAGLSYDRVTKICNMIACAICKRIKGYGVYIPPGLLKNRTIHFSLDNIDLNVDTIDGKGSFHGLASGVYQSTGEGEKLLGPLILDTMQSATGLADVPKTGIQIIPCNIEGNPCPRISPKYRQFEFGVNEKVINNAKNDDAAWLIARCISRMDQYTNCISDCYTDLPTSSSRSEEESTAPPLNSSIFGKQSVPNWSAYNSLCTIKKSEALTKDKSFMLPIINSSPQEWSTLVTGLDQIWKLNEIVSPGKRCIVTLDMDLYKRAVKLEYLSPSYRDKWIFSPGGFHTAICALRCIGQMIEGSGLDQAWQEAGLYSSAITAQIINGNHYNRALQCHQITLQALYDLRLECFFEENPNVFNTLKAGAADLFTSCKAGQNIQEAHQSYLALIESINLEFQLQKFDACLMTNPMYEWINMYMKQVMTLMQFLRSVRDANWLLYLATLEKLCVMFFAFNRLEYARHIPEYLARMQELKMIDLDTWNDFENGAFTVNSRNTVPFTHISVDQAMEHLNKDTKGQGGICGITSSPATLLKFCFTAPELANICKEIEELAGVSENGSTIHHELSASKLLYQEHSIHKLKNVLKTCNIFNCSSKADNNKSMFKLISNEIIPENVQDSLLNVEKRGLEAFSAFVDDRLKGDTNLWSRMTKLKFLSWNSCEKEIKVKTGKEILTLKATATLFARLLVIARSARETVDLEEVISVHELSSTNRTLLRPDGQLHQTADKSKVIGLLEGLIEKNTDGVGEASDVVSDGDKLSCLIVDGMVVLQELILVISFRNCKELGDAYVQLVTTRAKGYDHIRVIFDNYDKTESLKEFTRERRRGDKKPAKVYVVEDATPIKDVKSFIASNNTKGQLTTFLAHKLVDNEQFKILAATGKDVLYNFCCEIGTEVSSQEEADTLIILHALNVSKAGYRVDIYSHDTDVLLLALRRVPLLGKPSLIMGTGQKRRKVNLNAIFHKLGPDRAESLIKWHSLTGCDTTGHIYGKSKKTCFKAFLEAGPDVIAAINNLGKGSEPSEDVIKGCEKFLVNLLCAKNIVVNNAHELRWHMFCHLKEDQGVEHLPPTYGAWLEHIKRAHLQSNIWEQDDVLNPMVLDPLSLGWEKIDGKLKPLLSKVPLAPVSILQLVKCGCGQSKDGSNVCLRRCSCKRNNVICTELCNCSKYMDKCQNFRLNLSAGDIEGY